MPPIQTLTIKLGSDISEAISGLDAVGVKANKMGRNLQRTGRTLTRNVTLPLAALGAASFKVASDFESSLGKIEGLVGVQREQIDAWRGDIRSLAVDYGRSANEAADAMFFITSAGLKGSDALDVLEASLRASASGLGETKVVADLATSAMNAYGSETLSATDATDVLTAAVREGKLEPAELAQSMGAVLPVASAMGVSFDQVGGAMAAMSRTGTNASEAATQLRSILIGMMKPTAKGARALGDLGLSYEDVRKKIRDEGLLSALDSLTTALGDDAEATAAVFGNKRALVGVMDLFGANASATAEIMGNVADSSGAGAAAFEAQKTATLAMNQALAAGKDLLLEIGNVILPAATKAFETIRDVFKGVTAALGKMDMRFKRVALAVAAVTAAIGPLFLGLGGVLKVFAFALAPMGAVVTILGTLAFAIGVAAANWDVLKVKTTLVWAAIKSAVFSAIDGILGALEKIVGKIPVVGEKVRGLRAEFAIFADESLAKSGRKLAELEADLSSAGASMKNLGTEATEAGAALADGSGNGALERVRAETQGIAVGVVQATSGLREFKVEAIASKEEMIDFSLSAEEGVSELDKSLSSMASQGVSAIADFATGAKGAFGRFIKFALREVAKLIAKLLIVKALGFIAPGAGTFVSGALGMGTRAHGGPVTRNRPFLVGERGPEIFVPRTAGNVVSNRESAGGAGMSGDEILSILGPPPSPQTPREVARDSWYRDFIKIAVAENRELTGG